jgi:small subunit ribosomal protein S5
MRKIEDKQFDEEVLDIQRVTRVVAGGRRMRFKAIVVVGDRNGKIGMGTGKSNEVIGAVQKATKKAKQDMRKVTMVNGTIPHDVSIKYKSSKILLMPAGSGTGILAGSVIRKILALAGYKNILSKMFGSPNKLLNAQATFMALASLRTRKGTMNKENTNQAPAAPSEKNEVKKEPVEQAKKEMPHKLN